MEPGILLSWRLASLDRSVLAVEVWRADTFTGPFENVTRSSLAPEPLMEFHDVSANRNQPYWYQLNLELQNGDRTNSAPIEVRAGSGTPFRTLLLPPREFDSEVEVRYQVGPGTGQVQLEVFDMRGRLVRTLEARLIHPGEYQLRWNRQDNQGKSVRRGVYIIRLTFQGQQLARKIALLNG